MLTEARGCVAVAQPLNRLPRRSCSSSSPAAHTTTSGITGYSEDEARAALAGYAFGQISLSWKPPGPCHPTRIFACRRASAPVIGGVLVVRLPARSCLTLPPRSSTAPPCTADRILILAATAVGRAGHLLTRAGRSMWRPSQIPASVKLRAVTVSSGAPDANGAMRASSRRSRPGAGLSVAMAGPDGSWNACVVRT